MKQNGYITTTNKHHYILISEKRKVSIYMLAAIIRKMAETQNLPPGRAEAIMNNREARAEVRKRIEPCTLEISNDHYHIEIKNHTILNYPIDENVVVIFEEPKAKPIINNFYKED